MRARIRLSFLLLLSCSLLPLTAVSQAQIHGTPPSVTSFGFGGSNNPTPGVPASVTSLGPNGFGNSPSDCCFFGPNFFTDLPLFSQRQRQLHHHHQFPVGVFMPVYVPYAVPYAEGDPDGDDESPDVDYPNSRDVPRVYDRGPRYHDAPAPRQARRESASKAAAAPQAPAAPPEPVATQPATVLVFKDGHKSKVQNYAIVGETLFAFADGGSHKILLADLDLPATQKANDDRGVDFQVPAKTAQATPRK